ncbi:MAG: GNAT family N-acetyltransferase [Sedimentibacter sp.]|uniref:GNAT family N-acetyltransferase n=1 Tax=Sedimentibacter sp. TaxID=1960295 RepID=UPI002982488E|nr:GNAT family N-acetyltransferase [Sedimentibacter sp.]MDW5299069.1 GNAT family N-acetyltransferase [Sedimentibacter sp.]
MQIYKREDILKHKGTVTLLTDRFVLRKFKIDDANEVFCNWASDSDSAKYNACSVHSSVKVTEEYVSEWIDCYKNNNYYHWAVVDNQDDEVIGSISVSNVKNIKKYCEIGYTVTKKRWNQGIATEVLIRVLKFLVDDVGFKTVRAMHDVRNEASGKVMKKAGMVFAKNKTKFFVNGQNFVMKCCVYDYKNTK